jgi:hypothetical protein
LHTAVMSRFWSGPRGGFWWGWPSEHFAQNGPQTIWGVPG